MFVMILTVSKYLFSHALFLYLTVRDVYKTLMDEDHNFWDMIRSKLYPQLKIIIQIVVMCTNYSTDFSRKQWKLQP